MECDDPAQDPRPSLAAPHGENEAAGRLECRWQRNQLPEAIRELVLDDQRLRNDICWSVFDCRPRVGAPAPLIGKEGRVNIDPPMGYHRVTPRMVVSDAAAA